MASKDETGQRTEMPTELRLREARQRGQVARSADLSGVLIVLGLLGLLAVLGGALLGAMKAMLAAGLASAHPSTISAVIHGSTASSSPRRGEEDLAGGPTVAAVGRKRRRQSGVSPRKIA